MPRQLPRLHVEVAKDERGALLPIELDNVPFEVRRVFVVTGTAGGSQRGDHVVDCNEMIFLISGDAAVRVGESRESLGDATKLTEPGDYVTVQPGDYISYALTDEHSSLLVLADEPYSSRVGT